MLIFIDKLNLKQRYCIMQVTQHGKEVLMNYIFDNERPIYIQLVEINYDSAVKYLQERGKDGISY